MKFTSIRAIAKSVLLQTQRPLHYYLQAIKSASDCLRELHLSHLRVVNTRRLTVNSYGAVDLPCNTVDIVQVGLPVGQFVRPLHQQQGINRLVNLDSTGAKVTYGSIATDAENIVGGTIMYNDNEEAIGRFFGFNDGLLTDTYKFLPERNQIQLNEDLGATEIILVYIDNGSYCDAATKVDPLAQDCIEKYIKWQFSPNKDNQLSPEGRTYTLALRILRARKSGVTLEDIKRVFMSSVKPTI
jgi:hypothetical protein